MIRAVLFALAVAAAVLLLVHSFPVALPALFVFPFGLPARARIAALLATGLSVDLLSGHAFGLATLLLFSLERLFALLESLFRPVAFVRAALAYGVGLLAVESFFFARVASLLAAGNDRPAVILQAAAGAVPASGIAIAAGSAIVACAAVVRARWRFRIAVLP